MSMFSIFKRPLKTACLGVEITDTRIKVAEVQLTSNRRPVVTKVLNELLPAGTVADGRILNPLVLIQTIKTLLELHNIRTKQVHMVIPSQSIMVRQLKLPDLPDKQLRKVLEFEIKHNIHLPFDNPLFDFINLNGYPNRPTDLKKRTLRKAQQDSVLALKEAAASSDKESDGTGTAPANLFAEFESKDDTQPEEAPKADVLMVAAPAELVMEYAALLKDSGLKAVSAEIKACSILRIVLETELMSKEDTFLAVDINETLSDISIFHKGQLKITRSVPINMVIGKKEKAPEEEAFAAFLQSDQDSEFQTACGDLAHEMERLMNFYRYTLNNREQEFHTVIISGDIGRLKDAADYLEDRLNQMVKLMVTDRIESPIKGFQDLLPQIAVSVGLGMRGSTS